MAEKKRYRCVTECTWQGRHWAVGSVYEGTQTPPRHFVELGVVPTEPEEPGEPGQGNGCGCGYSEDAVKTLVRQYLDELDVDEQIDGGEISLSA